MALSFHKTTNYILLNPIIILLILIILTCIRVFALYISPLELSVDEAQYWDWSNSLAFGYFSKPPLISWLISFSSSIIGNDEWGIRIFSPILHFIIALILWNCSNILFGGKSGGLAALIWITLPASSLGSFIISTDTPLLVFWSISLLALIKTIKENKSIWLVTLGISLGLGFLTKYAMLYFVIILILFSIINNKSNNIKYYQMGLVLIIFFIIASPNIYWNYQHDLSTLNHTIHNANITGLNFNITEARKFFISQFLVFGPLLFLVFILNIWKYFFENNELSILAFFSITILLIIILQAFLKTSNANWAITAYPTACILISGLMLNKYKFFTKILINLGLLTNLILSAFILKISLTGNLYPLKLNSDPLRKLKGFESQAQLIKKLVQEEKPASIVYNRRSDITQFSYYLNRDKLIIKSKYFLSENKNPNNHYDYFYNFKKNNLNSNQKVLIITRNNGIAKKFVDYFSELHLLKKLENKNSYNHSRQIYIFRGIMK